MEIEYEHHLLERETLAKCDERCCVVSYEKLCLQLARLRVNRMCNDL